MGTEYSCTCTPGYEGNNCQVGVREETHSMYRSVAETQHVDICSRNTTYYTQNMSVI